jgi:hypothetical protein
MTSTSQAESNSALSPETRTHLDQLADLLLERYQVTAPPVPISLMLKQPLDQLWDTQYDQISFSLGHGIYEHAPRLAEARLLYRSLADNEAAAQAGFVAPWPVSGRAIKYFARSLLMPADWIRALPTADRTPDVIGEKFQVPPYDAIVRLAELGLPVPSDAILEEPDE